VKKQYEPKTEAQKVGYLVEECGEVQAAIGKTIRWGWESVNPELPPEQQETNRDWVLRELKDLKGAIRIVEEMLNQRGETHHRLDGAEDDSDRRHP